MLLPALLALVLGATAPPPSNDHDVAGRVLVQRPDGVVTLDEDGTLHLLVRDAEGERRLQATIRDGRWSADLPLGGEFQPVTVSCKSGDGIPADADGWLPVPRDGEHDLAVRFPRSFELRVYGPDGRAELQDVKVVRKLRRDARLPHPGGLDRKTQMVTGPTPSPIPVRVSDASPFTYFATAPGHAWGSVSVDPFLGGVQTLQLEAGGAVAVRVVQSTESRGKVLRLRRRTEAGLELVTEFKRYPGRLLIEGLAVGAYEVSSEDPIRPANMPVYGRADLQIVAGEQVALDLVLASEATFADVPAGGLIRIPPAWGSRDDLTFVLRRLDPYGTRGRHFEIPGDTLVPEPGYEDVFRWQLDLIPPGAYDFGVRPLGLSVFREVHGGGNLRVHLEVPEPRTFELVLVEERSGQPAQARVLDVSCLPPDVSAAKIPGVLPVPVEPRSVQRSSGEDCAFPVVVPATDVRVQLDDGRYERAERVLGTEVEGRHLWQVRRATGVRIELVDDTGSRVEWKGDGALVAAGHDGEVQDTRWVDGLRQLDVARAGAYTLTLPELAGFVRPAQQRLRLIEGQVGALRIVLERDTPSQSDDR